MKLSVWSSYSLLTLTNPIRYTLHIITTICPFLFFINIKRWLTNFSENHQVWNGTRRFSFETILHHIFNWANAFHHKLHYSSYSNYRIILFQNFLNWGKISKALNFAFSNNNAHLYTIHHRHRDNIIYSNTYALNDIDLREGHRGRSWEKRIPTLHRTFMTSCIL